MPNILIVDDEPDVRELFNITLSMAGHATTTVRDGLEAVEHLKANNPDLLVLDLMMPRLDGFGVLNLLRTEMARRPMRVLIATAKTLEEADQEKLTGWPIVGVLNKGQLDISRMVTVVSAALSREAMNPNPPADAPAAAPLEKSPVVTAPLVMPEGFEEKKEAEENKPAIQPIPPGSTAPTIQANRSDLAKRLEEAARQARAAMTAQSNPPSPTIPRPKISPPQQETAAPKKTEDNSPASGDGDKPDAPTKT